MDTYEKIYENLKKANTIISDNLHEQVFHSIHFHSDTSGGIDCHYRKDVIAPLKYENYNFLDLNAAHIKSNKLVKDLENHFEQSLKKVIKKALEKAQANGFDYIHTHHGFINNATLPINERDLLNKLALDLRKTNKFVTFDGFVLVPKYNNYEGSFIVCGLDIKKVKVL